MRTGMTFVLLAVSLSLVACSAVGETTTTLSQAMVDARRERAEQEAELERLTKTAEMFKAWDESQEASLARRLWRDQLSDAMVRYIAEGVASGDIEYGDCPLPTGLSIDCGWYDFYSERLEELEYFGRCEFLVDYGCSEQEEIIDPVFARFETEWWEQYG